MRRIAVAFLIALIGVPAATAAKPSPFARTVSCRTGEVTLAYDGRTVVVRAHELTLGRASQLTRSVSKTCTRANHFGVARHLLDHNNPAGRTTQVSCRGAGPMFIEVEPVRNGSGRIIGSRLAVWLKGIAGEMAEAVILPRGGGWLSWSSFACHAA